MNNDKDQHLVEGKYVHKEKPDNILLSNLRRALPTHIPKSMLDGEVEAAKDTLTIEEIKMLRSYYILHDEADIQYPEGTQAEKKHESEYYMLLNVPHFIDPSLLDNTQPFSSKEIEALKRFYTYQEKKGCYALTTSVSDVDELAVLTMLQRKDICMSESEKYRLAEILEKLPGIPRENIFYANMVVNTKHPFFFEHPAEHMPGLIIIEAARQLIVAQTHKFNRVPFDVSMILNSINATFRNYLDLHHPVRLKGVITNLRSNKKDNFPTLYELEISVIQADSIAAQVNITGQVISNRLFTKLRRTLPKENDKARYYPNHAFYNRITIRHNDSVWNPGTRLINISLHGFCIEMDEPISTGEGTSLYDFIICFEDVGFIFGKCKIVWQIEEGSKHYAGVEIADLSLKDRDHLYDAIKRYCYVIEEREIL